MIIKFDQITKIQLITTGKTKRFHPNLKTLLSPSKNKKIKNHKNRTSLRGAFNQHQQV